MKRHIQVAMLGLIVLVAGVIAACGGSPGQRACDYFRDDYLGQYFREMSYVDNHAPVQEETEKVRELAQDAEPEIRAAGDALLTQTRQDYNDPYSEGVVDNAWSKMIRACKTHSYWEDRPLE